MRTIKGAVAALAALAVVSACGVGQNSDQATTTSPAAIEESGNPWDLPIEQRPPLFDPCAEIPIEAVEEGVGGPVEPSEQLRNHRPGELFSCGWKNDEILVGALSTWKSLDEYEADGAYILRRNSATASSGFRALSWNDADNSVCRQLFFTSNGTVLISLDLVSGLSSFRGENFADACAVLDEVIGPLIAHIPEGVY